MRQIVLDTETTGLSPDNGDRLTEVGALEIIDRKVTGNTFQSYVNPERELSAGAMRITGLSYDKLQHEPKFSEIVEDFLSFIKGAELIIHNANFDLGFLAVELKLLQHPVAEDVYSTWQVIDTLELARKMHPGKKNNLDALCARYNIDNSARKFHGALLDAEILAEVYLQMTAGQLSFMEETVNSEVTTKTKLKRSSIKHKVKLLPATAAELAAHQEYLSLLKQHNDKVLWGSDE